MASVPVSDVSAPGYTNGVWLSLQPVSVAQKNKPSTMLFWTMRHLMAVQQLSQDLVQPSSEQ